MPSKTAGRSGKSLSSTTSTSPATATPSSDSSLRSTTTASTVTSIAPDDKAADKASFSTSPVLKPTSLDTPLAADNEATASPTESAVPALTEELSTDDVIIGECPDATDVVIIDDTEIAIIEAEEAEQTCNPEVEQAPEEEKSTQESGGILNTLAKGGAKVVQTVLQSGSKLVKSIGTRAAQTLGYVEYQVVYEKTTSITLPFGSVPKTHCRLITYTPVLRRRGQKPAISLTITPTGSCHHEDTHLFVRFCHS